MTAQTALITGATSGIGKALSYKLAEKEYDLLLLAKTQSKLDELAQELTEKYTVSCQVVCLNLDNQRDVEAFLQKGHPVDLAINCAGIGEYAKVVEYSTEKEQQLFQVNAYAPMRITKHYTKQFLNKGKGIVLNVCSTAALFPHPYLTSYAASKSLLFQYSIGLSEEVRRTNKKVQILTACPGPTRTPFFSKEVRERMTHTAWSRWFEMSPEHVAKQLMKQLEKKKRVEIIGRRNRWLVRGVCCLPYSLQLKVLGQAMEKGVLE